MTPGREALRRLRLARSAYESLAGTARLLRNSYAGNYMRAKHVLQAELRAADSELSDAIRDMEALP